MSLKTSLPIPPELREEVEKKAPEERRQIEQVWELLYHAEQEAAGVPEVEAAWAELAGRLQEGLPRADRRAAPDREALQGRRLGRLASSVATGLLLGLALWLWHRPVVVTAPPGARARVTLPDGSRAELNSGTSLRYRRGFQAFPLVAAGERRVSLEGEAFFDVVRAGRPFVVETFNARVEVLGTTFNVRARREGGGGETHVALASGRVRVRALGDPQHGVELSEAGHAARVAGRRAGPPPFVRAEPLDHALAWRQQGFAAVARPLASILADVERSYAVTITVEDGVGVADSMTVFYRRGVTAEQIVHDLCLAQGLRYRKTSQGFEVFADLKGRP